MAVPAPAAYDAAQTLEELFKELGLCACFRLPKTFSVLPETYAVTQNVTQSIKMLGIKNAFRFVGTLLLYSGPRQTIMTFLDIANDERNHDSAKIINKASAYTMVDHTKIGKEVDCYKGKGIFKFLEDALRGKTKNIQEQADFVMGFVSAAMILSASGNVETRVCGSDPSKVFLTYELPALMTNERITSINGVPAGLFRKVYYSGKPDAVYQTFQKICRAELAFLQQKSETAIIGNREVARQDRMAQLRLLVAERKEERKRLRVLKTLKGIMAGKAVAKTAVPRLAPV